MLTKRCNAAGHVGDRELPVERFETHRTVCKRCRKQAGRIRERAHRDADHTAAVITGGDTLASFGTPIEAACAAALLEHRDIIRAASAMQLEPGQLRAHLSELQRRAARRGWSPGGGETPPVPIGYHVKGKSTYYQVGPHGERRAAGEWIKTNADEEHKLASLLSALQVPVSELPRALPRTRTTQTLDDDLLAVYPMGDPHIGMLAWPAETGNAFDLAIAERNLLAAVDELVDGAPPARHALVVNLGDFFHVDGKANETTAGTPQDTDGRWPKILATGVRVMRRVIDRALEKHEQVTVINEIGNHDDHSSIMLSICLAGIYENEPRVTVDTSPQPFHWYRFGKVLIGVHHGNRVKREDLLGVMVTDRRKEWGEVKHCYWYIGHVHHDRLTDLPGCTVESFRTLAGRTAWEHGHGYRAGRDMHVIIHHREFGEIRRHTVTLSMLGVEDS